MGKVRVFDAVSGGDALLVLDVGSEVNALVGFEDLATGVLQLAADRATGRCASSTRSRAATALVVLEGHTSYVSALTAFVDPATGESRLVSGSVFPDESVRVWNPAAGSAAIEAEPEGLSWDVTSAGPLRIRRRARCGSRPGRRIRPEVWDAETGGALLVIDVGSYVSALAAFVDPVRSGAPRLACGTGRYPKNDWRVCLRPGRGRRGAARDRRWLGGGRAGALHGPGDGRAYGRRAQREYVRIFDPVAGGEALVVISVGPRT